MKNLIKVNSALIFLLCCALAVLLFVPFVLDKTILIGRIAGSQLVYGAIISILILSIILVIAKHRQNKSKKSLIIMIAVCVLSTILLFGTFFCYLLFMVDRATYYTFYSPDKKYAVIAEEWSWLIAGGVVLYERTSPFLVEKKASLITDDGFRAIRANAYEIEWDNNIVTFTVETMNGYGDKDTAIVEIKKEIK